MKKTFLLLFVSALFSAQVEKIAGYVGGSPETFVKENKLTLVKENDNFGDVEAEYKGLMVDGTDLMPKVNYEGGKVKKITITKSTNGKGFFANTAAELDKMPTTYKSFFVSKANGNSPQFYNTLPDLIKRLRYYTDFKTERGNAKFKANKTEYNLSISGDNAVLEISK